MRKSNQIKSTLIDHCGSDLSVVNAARVSFGKKSDWEEALCGKVLSGKDVKLIHYLATHKHYSPFGHAFASFHVKAPIFVARQLVKHEYLRWNEISRRYVDDEPEFYVPEVWRSKADNVKQGSSTQPKPHPEFTQGFCICCGAKVTQATRGQGGGKAKKYCSLECKTSFTNRHRDPYKSAFTNAMSRVKREGKRQWTLVHTDMEYPAFCPYLGLELDYSIGDKGCPQDNSPSFDRIDSSGDYTPDNVQVVSNLANTMKNSATKEQQVAFAKKVLLMFEGYVVDDTRTYEGVMKHMADVYAALIADGYPAEQARMVLPQSTMTEWYWSGSLDAFANMCKLRCASDTQYESRVVAEAISGVMSGLYPVSWAALTKKEGV